MLIYLLKNNREENKTTEINIILLFWVLNIIYIWQAYRIDKNKKENFL
jgi:hypothetical protein